MERKIKIVADSSADLTSLQSVDFDFAPLKIITSKKEYTDNADLDVDKMTTELYEYSGRSSTSCPNLHDWLRAFGDADEIYCVTITGGLSGSYNSACLAKASYEKSYPDRRVCVIDSRSAGPEIMLIIERIADRIAEGADFDTISGEVDSIREKTGLFFMLESIRNLANNGRVSPIVAKVVGLLGIRLVGCASEEGQLEPLDKCRGAQKAFDTLVKRICEFSEEIVRVRIAHCFAPDTARKLKATLRELFPSADIKTHSCRGLCSYYAERGGMLVGVERV